MIKEEDERSSLRPSAPALDAILGEKLNVLNDGFVRVVDYMGSDESIVQAARVSYGRGTKKVHEDRGLIRYLLRNKHTTPFEMCEIKLHIRAPMDCWRQWIRHRTASVNEYSTRYSIAIDSAHSTASNEWRFQSTTGRQGSSVEGISADVGDQLTQDEGDLLARSRAVYEKRLAVGVAREQARKDLPLSTYTEAYWKIDLHNLLHFLRLRMDTHAQKEIRDYATTIGTRIVALWCPIAWSAFEDYESGALKLSRHERSILVSLIAGRHDEAWQLAMEAGLVGLKGSPLKKNREREELDLKLADLGLAPPWSLAGLEGDGQ